MMVLTFGMVGTAKAGILEELQLRARAGYSIGGTTPVPLPETIRSIDSYSLTPSFMAGIDAQLPLNQKWGISVGLHFENKAMSSDVTTKAYHMELRRGESVMEGLFTGSVHQEVTEWMVTIPVLATLNLGPKVQLKAGPYFSLLTSRRFEGIASDGYLRQGDPTGAKVLIGNKDGEWATYDFSDDMRRFQTGIAIGADWQVYKALGLSLDLNWGLNGIFRKDFDTVEQTLYPIYATIGVFYRLK
jgi:hypothetical protein